MSVVSRGILQKVEIKNPNNSMNDEYSFEVQNIKNTKNRNNSTYEDEKKIDDEWDYDRYNSVFRISQFLQTLLMSWLYQLFGIFAAPLLVLFFGYPRVKNMQFLPGSIFFVFEIFFSSYSLMVVIMYFQYDEIFIEYLNTIIATLTAIMVRIIAVSVKYGTWPRKQFQQGSKVVMTSKETQRNLLLLSWIKIPTNIIDQEFQIACKQDEDDEILLLKFRDQLPKDIQQWSMKCPYFKNCQGDIWTINELPCQTFATLVVDRICDRHNNNVVILVNLAGVFYGFLAIIERAYFYGPQGFRAEAFEIIFTILSFGISAFAISAVFLFSGVGVYDFKRKVRMIQQCSSLISNLDVKHSIISENPPKLDMQDAETIMGWYKLRVMFLNFGDRYTKRIFIYVSISLVLGTGIIIVFLLQLVGLLSSAYNRYLIWHGFGAIVVLIILLYISKWAVRLNDYFEIHKDILLKSLSQVLRKIQLKQGTPALYDAKSALNLVIRKLEQDMIVRPIMILGLKMDNAFVAKLLAAMLSGIFALLNVLLR